MTNFWRIVAAFFSFLNSIPERVTATLYPTPAPVEPLEIPTPMPDPDSTLQSPPQEPVTVTTAVPLPTTPPPAYLWDTPANTRHSIRVLCDESDLSVYSKNVITACIQVESGFRNYRADGTPTIHKNLNKDGTLSTTDWGLCQINDWFHIGPHKDFPSVEYVMQNPEKVVRWMILMLKEGHINLWSSFSSSAYMQFMP